jgi:hypothetical protein
MAATGGLLAGALGIAVVLSHSPQLVSFVPVVRLPQVGQSLDPHDVVRALGGTPQLVKATMSAKPVPAAGHQNSRTQPVQPAVLKRVRRSQPSPGDVPGLAVGLAAEAAPLPELDRRTVVVLTEWTAYQMRERVVLAVARDRGAGAPARIIPARYAIVPTPSGWLIIQI